MSFRVKCTIAIALFANAIAHAAVETRWYVVSIDGKKIGHQRSELDIGTSKVRQTEILDVVIERGGQKATLFTETVMEETLVGKPLSFALRYRASERETLTRGLVRGNKVDVTESVDGKVVATKTIQLDRDTLFPYAQLQKLRQTDSKVGSKVRFSAFDPSVMQSFSVETTFKGLEDVRLPLGSFQLRAVEQRLSIDGAQILSEGLVDKQFTLYRLDTAIGGLKMRVEAATRAQALAANEQSTFFLSQFANAPRALSEKEEREGVFYRTRFKVKTTSLPPQTHEQRVVEGKSGLDILVCSNCGRGQKTDHSAAVLKAARLPTVWLQSNDAGIKAAAVNATKGIKTDLQKMQKLERFVSNHITDSNLNTAYASAKEAFENRSGDCTENALLLAAMGRAVGIPTRIVGGLAYAPNYLGQSNVFVPHAWMQAYVDKRWQSFDAALGFDAGHIALSITDGDPSAGLSGAALIGNLLIEKIDPILPSKEK
jgi:hypothetical protein